MEIKVQKSVPKDVYAIREVQKLTWLATYPNEQYNITLADIEGQFAFDNSQEGRKRIEAKKKFYTNKNIGTWVVKDGKKVVGFCSAVKELDSNRIGAIYVLPNYQGKGAGSMLIGEALKWLEEKKDIRVNVASYNKHAISFYKSFGFVKTNKKGIIDNAARLMSGKSIPEIELIKTFK